MRSTSVTLAVGAATALFLCSAAYADNAATEVNVSAARAVNTKVVGGLPGGLQILDVSLAYGVSTAGLDLGSHAGAAALEKRITDAAAAACKELSRQYPDGMPKDADCAKAATDKALVRAHELEAAAAKNAK